MPNYYRQSPKRQKTRNSPKQRASRREFRVTAPAILDVRKLRSSGKKSSRGRRTSHLGRIWWHMRKRAWNASHLLALLWLTLALLGLYYGFSSPEFTVRSVDVKGARYTSKDLVLKQAHPRPLSVFLIDPKTVSEQVKTLPHVREARVALRLPAFMRVEVTEREPLIQYQNLGQTFWIDEEGVLAPAAATRPDLIKLIDESGQAPRSEERIDPALLNAILYISNTLPEVRVFRYQEPFGLFFFSPEGWRVLLGTADGMSEKLRMWEAVRKEILQSGAPVREVDLRYSRPYWR